MRYKDKVALVTGAGRGIGKAIAIALAEEGASIVVNDIDLKSAEETANEIKAMGCKAVLVKADVSNTEQVIGMVEKIIEIFKRIDILVNNAGIFSSVSLEDMTEDEWDKVMSVNLKGVFLCSQAVMKFFKKQQSGRIVNVASLADKVGGIFAGANYAASKAGVISLTKSLARQLAPYGINVNAVAPAVIETEMVKGWPKDIKETLLRQVPLGRFGRPEEVAKTVAFLLSDEAAFITGATIDINGGLLMD